MKEIEKTIIIASVHSPDRRNYIYGAFLFYGTSLSSLRAWNIALKCGFYPTWVAIETFEK